MTQLTEAEISLLEQLDKCEQAASGDGRRQALQRLIEAGWVKEHAPNATDRIYAITEVGRSGLRYQRPTPPEIPAEELNASNDE